MRLKAYELHEHLAQGIASVYYVAGNESFLVQDACNSVLTAFRAKEPEVLKFEISKEQDWVDLVSATRGSSIFACAKYIEVMLAKAPSQKAAGRISSAFSDLDPDCVALFRCKTWDRNHMRTSWFRWFEQHGVVVLCESMYGRQEQAWVEARAGRLGLKMTKEALGMLAAQTEGNALAAAQELEKLALVFGETETQVKLADLSSVDARRATIFGLVDCALDGETKRVHSLSSVLRRDGSSSDPIAILAVLMPALRQAYQISRGGRLNLWGRRKASIPRLASRHRTIGIERLLQEASYLDSLQKGALRGNAWDATERFLLDVAGQGHINLEQAFPWARIEY